MDDFRLKVFITAARTLSFTRTAEQMFISQPAVSKHVGELESRYKVQLFVRRGSRLGSHLIYQQFLSIMVLDANVVKEHHGRHQHHHHAQSLGDPDGLAEDGPVKQIQAVGPQAPDPGPSHRK